MSQPVVLAVPSNTMQLPWQLLWIELQLQQADP